MHYAVKSMQNRLRGWLNRRKEKQWAGERWFELPKSEGYTGGRVILPVPVETEAEKRFAWGDR